MFIRSEQTDLVRNGFAHEAFQVVFRDGLQDAGNYIAPARDSADYSRLIRGCVLVPPLPRLLTCLLPSFPPM
jgi:hypothetical protein